MTVSFAGKDFPPEIIDFGGRVKEDGYNAAVIVWAKDDLNVREDAGIKEILLYENNKHIYSESGKDLFGSKTKTLCRDIVHHNPGTYRYHAEIINNAGVKSTTKPLELKFF